MRRGLRLSLIAAVALATGVGAAVTAAGLDRAKRSSTLAPEVEPAVRGEQCIADPALMRRSHMDMLRHQRDETVRQGIRGASASLKGCINCHASARTGSVAKAPTDFCVSCHSYAAVQIDCFDCHASRPAHQAAATAPSEAPK
jgi:hypothetical protein